MIIQLHNMSNINQRLQNLTTAGLLVNVLNFYLASTNYIQADHLFNSRGHDIVNSSITIIATRNHQQM